MTDIVQMLQIVSGMMWLLPAIYLTPRIASAFRVGSTHMTAISARNAFIAWLMVGFVVRWLVWPRAIGTMSNTELVAWGALYALSSVCALWFFRDALNMSKAR